jgi:hypothetical protein
MEGCVEGLLIGFKLGCIEGCEDGLIRNGCEVGW